MIFTLKLLIDDNDNEQKSLKDISQYYTNESNLNHGDAIFP